MAKTITEIATRVLKKLGRLPEGQTATANQISTITAEYNELYQELLDDGLVNWTASDNVPDDAAHAIYTMLLSRVADDFGNQNVWLQLEQTMRLKLSRFISKTHTHDTTTFLDF